MSQTVPFTTYFDFSKKSKRKAGDGLDHGEYPFFVSSQTKVKRTDNPDYEGEALVFGTGGNASVHYASGKFSASGDCLIAFEKEKEAAKAIDYFLKGNMHLLEEGFKGAGLKHISKKYISDIQLPDLEKLNTTHINLLLDKADEIRKKRQQAIEMLDELLRATFLDMFGDPAENPNNYDLITVEKTLLDPKKGIQSGPFGSALKKEEFSAVGVPAWAMDNVQPNKFIDEPRLFIPHEKYSQLKRYAAENGDILISRAGTVGRMAVFNSVFQDSIITTNLVRLRLNKKIMLPEYFSFLFSYFGERLGSLKVNEKDNAFSFLNPTKLRTVEIPKPKLNEQESFVSFLNEKEALKKKLEDEFIKITNLFNSLTQRAFKGEL